MLSITSLGTRVFHCASNDYSSASILPLAIQTIGSGSIPGADMQTGHDSAPGKSNNGYFSEGCRRLFRDRNEVSCSSRSTSGPHPRRTFFSPGIVEVRAPRDRIVDAGSWHSRSRRAGGLYSVLRRESSVAAVYHIPRSLVKLSNGLRHRKEEVGSGDGL